GGAGGRGGGGGRGGRHAQAGVAGGGGGAGRRGPPVCWGHQPSPAVIVSRKHWVIPSIAYATGYEDRRGTKALIVRYSVDVVASPRSLLPGESTRRRCLLMQQTPLSHYTARPPSVALRSAHGRACSICEATLRSRSSRP